MIYRYLNPVLIIGASGGVGRATAIQLAQEGFDVLLHYNSNKDIAEELKASIQGIGRRAVCCKADLLYLQEVDKLIETVKRNFPNLSAFVNCSTVKLPNIKFEDMEWNNIEQHININIKVNFLLLKQILPIFENQKHGKIVFLTTQYIETPTSGLLHYITSKSALNGFVKAIAIEFAARGININMVSPSMIDTDLVADIPQKAKMLIEAKTPLKRLCKPKDVAQAIVFLLSEKSNFITGETIRVNGGQVML